MNSQNYPTPKFVLEIAVFICGASVMVFELVGSRMLAPYLGTSIFVWTGLIGVILAFLSLGYWLGGKIADKKTSIEVFALVIFLAAISILITSRLSGMVLPIFSFFKTGLELSSLLSSIILFAPASVLFGIISPYAVKLKIKSIESSASAVGNLYAISTTGSIFGTFLAGFFLIPFFGTTRVLLILTLVLIILSAVIFPWKKSASKALPALLCLLFFSLFFSTNGPPANLLLDKDTAYNRIQIRQSIEANSDKDVLTLSIDPFSSQSVMFFDSDELQSNYLRYFDLASHFCPNFQKTLLLGGAAFIYPKHFFTKFPTATMDVVEIDPAMVEIAKQFFRLKDNERLNVFHEDGRVFLNRTQKKYDVIFGDAFNSAFSLPFQLTTKEAVKKEHSALNVNGVVIVNIISLALPAKSKFLLSEIKTYQSVFPQVYLFSVPSENRQKIKLQNIILVALKSNAKPILRSDDPQINEFLQTIFSAEIPRETLILTDDFAPVEYYSRELVEKYY